MLYQTKNPHGGDIYEQAIILDYSANTNPLGTPQNVLDAMRQVLGDVHHYPDPYCRELVQAISRFEQVSEEYILCGNGAADLIYAYCEAIQPHCAVELAPTFSEYALGLARVGCRVERYFLQQEQQFDLQESFLEYLEEQKPDVVFLCNPNNPTGRLIPTILLEKILRFCANHNIHLFLDECFLDLSEHGVSMKQFLQDYPQLYILKAFTKSYGMAGIRLGYGLCSDRDLLTTMSRSTQPWNVSLLAQVAGVAALQDESFLQKTRSLIVKERQWLQQELEALGFWVCSSCVNYLLFHGMVGLHEKLRVYGIAIRNCDNYVGLTSGWYRIAVRTHAENEQLLSCIRLVCGKESKWQKI